MDIDGRVDVGLLRWLFVRDGRELILKHEYCIGATLLQLTTLRRQGMVTGGAAAGVWRLTAEGREALELDEDGEE